MEWKDFLDVQAIGGGCLFQDFQGLVVPALVDQPMGRFGNPSHGKQGGQNAGDGTQQDKESPLTGWIGPVVIFAQGEIGQDGHQHGPHGPIISKVEQMVAALLLFCNFVFGRGGLS